MRALVQRVSHASVKVGDVVIGSTGKGLVVLIGVGREDGDDEARYIVEKTTNLRIFPDDEGRFDRSALDATAELLVVSQFTLYADTRKGRRPSFLDAAEPDHAEAVFNTTAKMFEETGLRVATGRFQAHMVVSIDNDGPVTIMLDSADRQRPRRRSKRE